MGSISVEEVVQLLSDGGIRAAAAFPAERITRITEPVAAVSLAQMDQEKQTATVLVEILGPQESGGHVCQQKALTACAILADAGAVCKQGICDFLSKSNVFCVKVEAVFSAVEPFTIVTGTLTLSYACGFSSEQKVDSTYTSLQDAPWEFSIEEFFPWGIQITVGPAEPFQVDVRCAGNVERYEQCTWTERKRISEKTGIRQIRKGKAKGRILTSE